MAHEIVMPQLGLAMESGRIIAWLKQPGEFVRAGEVLLEVETDKVTTEVEAVASGIVQIVQPSADVDVTVGVTVGYILTEGEAPVTQAAAVPLDGVGTAADTSVQSQQAPSRSNESAAAMRRLPSTPAARRRAAELGIDWRQAPTTGERGQVRERDVVALAASMPAPSSHTAPESAASPRNRITPVARRLAEVLGVDLDLVIRLFPDQHITRDHIEATVRSLLQARREPTPAAASAPERVPLTTIRRLIGERMAGSTHTAAPVTLTTEVDATELVRLRETLREIVPATNSGHVPSYNVIIAKLAATALCEHPHLNSTLEADTIVVWPHVHIGIAVDTERGLVVPVLRDVERKSLGALAAEGADLLTRASAGKARAEELSEGTFTITNLGALGIDAFTPIINLPQCAILGVGRIVRRLMVADDDTTRICSMLTLSLTFDHRIVDGAPAARFLKRICAFIEQPYLWLTK